MQHNALVRLEDVFERAMDRAALVRRALEILAQDDIVLDFGAIAADLVHRVCVRYGGRLDRSRDLQSAKAYAVLIINLALDRVTGGDAQEAAAALRKNDPGTIYLIGERMLDEDRPRIEAVLKQNIVRVRDTSHAYHWFEMLSAARRDQLTRWARVGVLMRDGWSPSTMADLESCRAEIELSEFDVRVARAADWQRIVHLEPEAAFAHGFFRRQTRAEPSAAGGLWDACLRSLYINAMMNEAWLASMQVRLQGRQQFADDDEVRRRLFVRPDVLRLFVERVVIEPDSLADKYPEATFRVAQTLSARHGGEAVFAHAVSHDDIARVCRQAESLLRELAQDAYRFYLAQGDPAQIPLSQLEQFWNARVLLVSTVSAELRMAQAMAASVRPWERVVRAATLDELAALVAGFGGWPPEECERFFAAPSAWMRVLEDAMGVRPRQSPAAFLRFLDAFAAAEAGDALLAAVPWSHVPILLVRDVVSDVALATAPLFGRVVAHIALAGHVSHNAMGDLLMAMPFECGFASAVERLGASWNADDWTRAFHKQGLMQSRGKLRALWHGMRSQDRPAMLSCADGDLLGAMMAQSVSHDEAQSFVLGANAWANTDTRRRRAVWCWVNRHDGSGIRRHLEEKWPGTNWDALFTVRAVG